MCSHVTTKGYAITPYSNASLADIGEDLFNSEDQRLRYIAELQATRDKLASDPSPFLPQEPFALVHGDFCGRNIMIHEGHVRAIIDWEFAGSYPLSELLGGSGVELFELEDENLTEYGEWSNRLRDMLVEKARSRDWDEGKIDLLVGDGNRELQLARREMVPLGSDHSDQESANGDDDLEDTSKEVSGLTIDNLP